MPDAPGSVMPSVAARFNGNSAWAEREPRTHAQTPSLEEGGSNRTVKLLRLVNQPLLEP